GDDAVAELRGCALIVSAAAVPGSVVYYGYVGGYNSSLRSVVIMRSEAAAIIYRRVAADEYVCKGSGRVSLQAEAAVMIACGIAGEDHIGKFGITCIIVVHPAAIIV